MAIPWGTLLSPVDTTEKTFHEWLRTKNVYKNSDRKALRFCSGSSGHNSSTKVEFINLSDAEKVVSLYHCPLDKVCSNPSFIILQFQGSVAKSEKKFFGTLEVVAPQAELSLKDICQRLVEGRLPQNPVFELLLFDWQLCQRRNDMKDIVMYSSQNYGLFSDHSRTKEVVLKGGCNSVNKTLFTLACVCEVKGVLRLIFFIAAYNVEVQQVLEVGLISKDKLPEGDDKPLVHKTQFMETAQNLFRTLVLHKDFMLCPPQERSGPRLPDEDSLQARFTGMDLSK